MTMDTLSPFTTPADAEASEPSHERIAARAQELWSQSGRPEGHDLDFWLEAEAELRAICHREYRHPHNPLAA